MRHFVFSAAALFLGSAVNAQWQQEIAYRIDATLNPKEHRLNGTEEIRYVNHSPDTLNKLFFHLYFNAFQPQSAMDVRQRLLPDPDKRIGGRIEKLKPKEQGYQEVNNLFVNGEAVDFLVEGTVLEATLTKPILPGESATIAFQFEAQVPVQIRRSGRDSKEGIDYTMTQWYPKMAAYDANGWHANPYIAREFYGVFGSYEVNLTLPATFVVGGTGEVQNPCEVGHGYCDQEVKHKKKDLLTWRFKAEKVHDFAWAADEDYTHYTVAATDSTPTLHFLYAPSANQEVWKEQLPTYAMRFFSFMNKTFGTYPYPQFSLIQGGDGGMEYPMCTMMLGAGKSAKGIVGLFAHEAAHNWFYGVIGTDEFRYPWMDEGFTSFAESEAMAFMYEESANEKHLQAVGNLAVVQKWENREPLSTPADYFETNQNYGVSSYSIGEALLTQLIGVLGKDAFWEGMKRYYSKYQFKSPGPWQFIREMERASGVELDWYLNQWLYTMHVLDYGIEVVKAEGRGNLRIDLKRHGNLHMPCDLVIRLKSGALIRYYIPLDEMRGVPKGLRANVLPDWTWTHVDHEVHLELPYENVQAVYLNLLYADTKAEDNVWEATTE